MSQPKIAVAGQMIDTQRCLVPVEYYEVCRPRDQFDVIWPRDEAAAVCWRPAGHPPGRHVSKAAYLRALEYRRRRGHPERIRRRMSEAASRVSA